MIGNLETIAKQITANTDSDHNEATSYPFWAIVQKGGFGHHVFLAGPWFSREAAQNYLTQRAYNYSKTAFVYCFSGHNSQDYRELLTACREVAKG